MEFCSTSHLVCFGSESFSYDSSHFTFYVFFYFVYLATDVVKCFVLFTLLSCQSFFTLTLYSPSKKRTNEQSEGLNISLSLSHTHRHTDGVRCGVTVKLVHTPCDVTPVTPVLAHFNLTVYSSVLCLLFSSPPSPPPLPPAFFSSTSFPLPDTFSSTPSLCLYAMEVLSCRESCVSARRLLLHSSTPRTILSLLPCLPLSLFC